MFFFKKKKAAPEAAEKTEPKKEYSVCTVDPEKVRSKIAASLIGGALGDALGYPVEFKKWKLIREKYGTDGISDLVLTNGKAIISDDTQMTLFTAEAMYLAFVRGERRGIRGEIEMYIHQDYLNWLNTQGGHAKSGWTNSKLITIPEMNFTRAPGITCIKALESGEMGTVDKPINNSKGCGGVMRTAPLGFAREAKTGELIFGDPLEKGSAAAAVTHGHPMGWIPGGMLADIIDRCIYYNYDSLTAVIEDSLEAVVKKYGEYEGMPEFQKMIRLAIELGKKNRGSGGSVSECDEPAIRSIGEGWVGDEALAIAIYAVIRHENNFKDCLRVSVNHSGDSDSTGAIAGNILGAYLGLDAIPDDWVKDLELTSAMNELADNFKEMIEYSIF